MAEGTDDADLIRSADVRLCCLLLWSNFEGFGFRLKHTSHPPQCVSLIESNSPAAAGGLKIQDIILAVDGQDMSKADLNQVEAAVKISRDTLKQVELLVVEHIMYEALMKRNICIRSISASVLSTPTRMPSDYITFPRNTPRLCKMCFGKNDVTFGFTVVDGEHEIGAYIQTVLAHSLAIVAGLRENDRIIEINGQNVDKDSFGYIRKKLDKAKTKRKLKLFVVDTQTYEYYMKHNIKFNSKKSPGVSFSFDRRKTSNQQIDRKNIHEQCDNLGHIGIDELLSKHDVIRPTQISSGTSSLSKNVYSHNQRSNDTKTIAGNRQYASCSTMNEETRADFASNERSNSGYFKKDKVNYFDRSFNNNESYDMDNISYDHRDASECRSSDTKSTVNCVVDRSETRTPCATFTARSTSKHSHRQTAEAIFTSSSEKPIPRCSSLSDLRKSNPSLLPSTPSIEAGLNVCNGVIQVCQGDLTKQVVDAIVIASTSNRLTTNILQQAGTSIKTVYETEKRKNSTKSITTNGGRLSCNKIYFIPCPQLSKNADKWVFRKFVSEAVQQATNDNTHTIQSIAFPAIGCGQYNCNSKFVAKTLITAVAYELKQQPLLKLHTYFVIQQDQQNIFNAFRNELMSLKTIRSLYATNRPSVMETYVAAESSTYQNKKTEFFVEKRLLNHSSSDYTTVVNEFRTTMTGKLRKEIVRVELVWNERWYKQYQIHRDEFYQRLKTDTEKYLFHGCAESAANSIIEQCFNRSYAGQHGTNYGHGVYFSSKASYSHGYTTPNAKGERCMFLARVLIGKTIVGNSSTKICPVGHDTTTNGSDIYVIYHDAQAFGQYLITYK